ncbi:MAG: helix-turn-helix transcriptional regulator [Bacilli bacterium]|nr:helix-turn-helix transcriptional regulator [Bacilli bacterium]
MDLLNEVKVIDLSELFKIFGDSTRIKIINVLLYEELCVSDISKKINVSQSAVSHQLRILKSSKLVKYRKDANLIYYSLADDHVKEIFELGCEHINEV